MIRKCCSILLLALCSVALLKYRVIWQPSALPVEPTAMSWIIDSSKAKRVFLPSEEGFIELGMKRIKRNFGSVTSSEETTSNSDFFMTSGNSDTFSGSGSGSYLPDISTDISTDDHGSGHGHSSTRSESSSEILSNTILSTGTEPSEAGTKSSSETSSMPTLPTGTEPSQAGTGRSSETSSMPTLPTGAEPSEAGTKNSSEISFTPTPSTGTEPSEAGTKNSSQSLETSPTTATQFPETSNSSTHSGGITSSSVVYCVSNSQCDSKLNQSCVMKGNVSICGCDESSLSNPETKQCEAICNEDYCGKTGTCNVVNSQPVCRCHDWYYGKTCQVSMLILAISVGGASVFLIIAAYLFGRWYCKRRKVKFGSFSLNNNPAPQSEKEQIALEAATYVEKV